MAKKLLLLIFILALLASCFIPVTQKENLTIKTPFLNLYSFLVKPEQWEKWRPELRQQFYADSAKIAVQKKTPAFAIKYNQLRLDVSPNGNFFDIDETDGSSTTEYGYALYPDKKPKSTIVTVYRPTNIIGYLFGKLRKEPFAGTHIGQLKNFIETDSLYYGFKIVKMGVPGSFLIVTQNTVKREACFEEAAALINKLRQFADVQKVKKIQPLIAQFTPAGKDSLLVKVGFYIDKEVKPGDGVEFNRMPRGGPLYTAVFSGKFEKRQRAYDALNQYYTDHSYQSAILPFEMYLDDRLPTSDTSKVLVRINFSGFF